MPGDEIRRINAKGQVTIPVAIRRKLGIRPGDEMEVLDTGPGYLRSRKRMSQTRAHGFAPSGPNKDSRSVEDDP
jgi:AbrB family looped-hinge helix DNA binding protein